jgi:beta-N-acetylhexosaminidase
LAGAFNAAMQEQGVLSCGKHFPGYSAATDRRAPRSPKIERTRDQLDEQELAVFRSLLRQPFVRGPHVVDSMMICHGWYPCFNRDKKPASLAREVVTTLLRDELRFDGLNHDRRPRYGCNFE